MKRSVPQGWELRSASGIFLFLLRWDRRARRCPVWTVPSRGPSGASGAHFGWTLVDSELEVRPLLNKTQCGRCFQVLPCVYPAGAQPRGAGIFLLFNPEKLVQLLGWPPGLSGSPRLTPAASQQLLQQCKLGFSSLSRLPTVGGGGLL